MISVNQFYDKEYLALETSSNAFTDFYCKLQNECDQFKRKKSRGPLSDVQKELRNYKHTDGIAFAARSRSWTLKNSNPVLPRNRLNKVATSKQQKGVRAYYRVLAENNKKYILIACHVNMHGFHRGDLRFVEVNDRTIAKGFENFSVIGRLFTGDVVAVTSLAIKSKSPLIFPNVDNVHPDGNCIWEVKEMTVLTRKDICDANFATLENGTAILEGYGEAMNVDNERNKNVRLPTDKMYSGKAFFPEKMVVNFTEDFHNSYWEDLIALSAKMISYPNSLGTVFSYSLSETQTRLLEIGTKAFDTETFLSYPKQRDEIVEKCVRMGASAVQAVLNGRFDARGFQIKDIIRKDFIVQFSIANPAERPTEGRWNNNMRVMLNGGGELLTGVIETVLVSDRRNLQIVVRIPSNSPKNIDFSNKWVVHQQESPLVPICEIGFFKKMHATSNGRRTIETLYGGPPIQINRKDWQSEFVFPAKQPIALNEFQNQYVRLILADVPLVIGNSPFGCGKSMTIVTAAIEIHKRNNRYNKYGKKQLLITQSNNAGVSLVEISQKIVGNSIKFLRYVSEPNWNLLPDSSRTVIDMPVLMKHYFVGWALGTVFGIEQTKHLTDEMKRAIVRKVIQDFTTPEKLQGEAKTIYENMETMHKEQIPLLEILIEAFFVIYNPDVIVSTADSYKCLVKLDILKHVSNIQIDEASQLPEYTLIYLLQKFPNSGFGLVGDIKQLPPHCDSALSGLLKKYGIGNTMERAARADMFPQSDLLHVYRCHPTTTHLLSRLFYENQLISGVYSNERNEFMRMRSDIWPNLNFSILFLNHTSHGSRMGTSVVNQSEKRHVLKVVELLTNKVNEYCLPESDIGVISLYKAQTSLLTEALRGKNVKCGTVDAFQGSEREVIIVCCTNNKATHFMQNEGRVNVAMSRARQATIIIGNVQQLREAEYWKTIIEVADKNICYIDKISSITGSDFLNVGSGSINNENEEKANNKKNVAKEVQLETKNQNRDDQRRETLENENQKLQTQDNEEYRVIPRKNRNGISDRKLKKKPPTISIKLI